MGEIVAGIALGPSLFGSLLPELSSFVFPPASFGNLQLLSQIGLILFMFVIGMELDLNIIKQKARAAVIVGIVSIALPFVLGVGLAAYMYHSYATVTVPYHAFALFMGIAMSITAFPVLARIIRERGITHTRVGAISLTSAAIGDVAGWCILAVVIAIAKAEDLSSSLYTIAGAIIYMLIMLFAIRPLLKKLSIQKSESKLIRQSTMAIILVVLLLSSYCCEVIGIHALFGAFMAGIIMPLEWDFRNIIINKIEDIAMVMLLPIFFVLTGLRTQIGLLNDTALIGICMLIVLVAIVGKLAGGAIAAKLSGESTYNSMCIGALMNTRGLMELIILNIGYDLGILSAQVFTMMVIMALVTTFMTSPLLSLFGRLYKQS
jgi:Kef-type K+ transport system membrane component KefB